MINQPFAVPALLLFIAAIPLIFGLVPRNRFYGVRMPKTLSNDKIWYSVNRHAAVVIMIGSSVYGMVAVFAPYDRSVSGSWASWGIHLAAFVVPIVIGLYLTIRYAKRL
jgi:hypothetical protein